MFDFTNVWLKKSAGTYAEQVEKLKKALSECDAVLIGAGSGLSTSAGFTYSGERFEKFFGDFADKYHFADMYTGGFRVILLPPEELWAYWSRNIYINRYMDPPKPVYKKLFELVRDKDYFVLTTNVDHCFQKAGFDKQRIFYTQGDYGLWQCSEPCHDATYDNAETVRKMVLSQGFLIAEDGTLTVPKGVTLKMTVPAELVPRCPVCGKPMSMNEAVRRLSGGSRRAAAFAAGAGRRRQHAGHHQVSLLAHDGEKQERHLRLRQPRRRRGAGQDRRSLDLHRRGHRRDAGGSAVIGRPPARLCFAR